MARREFCSGDNGGILLSCHVLLVDALQELGIANASFHPGVVACERRVFFFRELKIVEFFQRFGIQEVAVRRAILGVRFRECVQCLLAAANSSIGRTSADSLITAGSVHLEIDSSPSGNAIGSSAAPIRVNTSNLESHTHNLGTGIFIDAIGSLIIGGVTDFGGGVRGIQAQGGGDVQVRSTGSITLAEDVSTLNNGSVTLTAA